MAGTQRELTTRFLAEPTDVNFGGKVHGGMVMKWIDQAGYACAVGWSGAYCVTVAVGGIQFLEPIMIGDLVSVECRLVRTGTSSMQIAAEVRASDLRTGSDRLATSCIITFVALDSPDGRPTAVPTWTPKTAEDRRLAQRAAALDSLSRAMEREVAADVADDAKGAR